MTFITRHLTISEFTSGVMDFRAPGMTQTPNAALFFGSGNEKVISNVLDLQARNSFGVASKQGGVIHQGVVAGYSEDGVADTNTKTYASDNLCFAILNDSIPSTAAQFVDFLDDNGQGAGVRLTFSAVADAAMTIVLIHASAGAKSGTITTPGSVGGTNSVDVGFRPTCIQFFNPATATTGAAVDDLRFSYGAMATDDLTQRCYAMAEDDAVGAGAPVLQAINTRVAANINVTTGAISTAWEVTALTGTGFTLTQRTGTDAPIIFYLALRTSPSLVDIVDIDSRTSGGTQAPVSGFRPQLIVHAVSRAEAWNTAYTDSRAYAMGINIYGDSQSNARHHGIVIADAADPTSTASSVSSSLNGGVYPINSYTISNAPEADMSYVASRDGWTLTYNNAPATTQRWWALAFQVDVPNENTPYRSRMYSLLHGLSLSMVVRQSPLSLVAAQNVDNLAYRMTAYSHEIAADGGYMSAQLSFPARREEIAEWLEYSVGKEFAVYNEGQQICWLGVIDNVDASIGGVSFNSGSLSDVANRVAVAYRRQSYNIPGIDIGGDERVTDFANDTDSQAFFGILSALLNGGESSASNAESLRGAFLNELAQLRPTQTYNYQSNLDVSVRLNCIGYYSLLDRFFYEATGGGTVDADEKIRDVLSSDPNALFDNTSPDIDTNTYQVRVNEDGQGSGLSAIRATTVLGDSSNNRWIAGALHNRRFFFRSVPTTPELMVMLSDAGALLRTTYGGVVHPWNATPGKWLVIPDISLSRVFPFNSTTTVLDRRPIFVESVQYTAPYGLQVGGGRASSINQRLAKLGLGGI